MYKLKIFKRSITDVNYSSNTLEEEIEKWQEENGIDILDYKITASEHSFFVVIKYLDRKSPAKQINS